MCFVEVGHKRLLIVVSGDEGLFAYNTETDKLEWKVNRKLSKMEHDMTAMGVTTDGHGHLFVTDRHNHCIQMFSVSDGSYMGFLETGDDTLRCPSLICWCENMSSLLSVWWYPAKLLVFSSERTKPSGMIDFNIGL